MEQNEFVSHPILTNYEANRNGIIRNCRLKKPVGIVNNAGYLVCNTKGNNLIFHTDLWSSVFWGRSKTGMWWTT